MVQQCLQAANILKSRDISVTVADARFCKPLDTDLIKQLANEHEILITVEEGSIGGFGSHVSHYLSLTGILDGPLKVISFDVRYFKLPIKVLGVRLCCYCCFIFIFFLVLIFLELSLQLRAMVLLDRYIDHGSPQDQIEEVGLSARNISATILSLLGRPKEALQLK